MLHTYLPGTVRDRIKDLLKEKDMTQGELAKRLDVSESTLNRFLSGQTEKLSTESLVTIAQVFNVSTDFVLGLTDIPYTTNYDLERLGFNKEAAEKLLNGSFDMRALNMLMVEKDFATLTFQLGQLYDGTLSAGTAVQSQIISQAAQMLKEYQQAFPSERKTVKQVLNDIIAAKPSPYQVDTSNLEATFQRIILIFRKGSQDAVRSISNLTTKVMQELVANLPRTKSGKLNLHGVTREDIADAIVAFMPDNSFSQDQKNAFHDSVLTMLEPMETKDNGAVDGD